MVKKITIAIVSLVALLATVIIPTERVSAHSFTDIPGNSYDTQVDYLVERNIIAGINSTKFGSDLPITREHAITIIGRAIQLDGTPRAGKFTDVPKSSPYSGYIVSATEKGIISGASPTTFAPERNITRGEMAVVLTRAFDLTATGPMAFKDVTSAQSYEVYINRLTTAKITAGYPDNTYRPDQSITRIEFAVMIARAINPDFKVQGQQPVVPKPPVVTPTPEIKYVNSSTALNVRTGPGVGNPAIASLSKGTKVTVYQKEGEWVYIVAGNVKGYVNGGYLSTTAPVVSKRLIVIDPGHGGSDPGASANGVVEKEVTLDVSLRVQKYLEAAGTGVIMTRTKDVYPSLSQRVSLAKSSGADTFVSIHANAAGSEAASGTETYLYAAARNLNITESRKLAEFIQVRLYKAMDTKNRGVKHGDFHVIRENPLPGVLIELGFVTNKSDAAKLKDSLVREASAKAIADGIEDYYNWLGK